jgi:hypothetical protein
LNGVTIGQSPVIGTLTLNYGEFEGGYGVSFTLHGQGGTVSGFESGSVSPNAFTGSVVTATGSYAGLSGGTFSMSLSVSPETLGFLPVPLINPNVALSVVVGSLSITG